MRFRVFSNLPDLPSNDYYDLTFIPTNTEALQRRNNMRGADNLQTIANTQRIDSWRFATKPSCAFKWRICISFEILNLIMPWRAFGFGNGNIDAVVGSIVTVAEPTPAYTFANHGAFTSTTKGWMIAWGGSSNVSDAPYFLGTHNTIVAKTLPITLPLATSEHGFIITNSPDGNLKY